MTPLQKGDLVAIVSPAKSIEKKFITYAVELFEKQGYKIWLGQHVLGQFNYFSGTDEERCSDFQQALDHPDVKAIVCARGGYGAIRIIDRIQWASFIRAPKWIIGFSDITVFHQRVFNYQLESIHASMPLNFEQNSTEAISTLLEVLAGDFQPFSLPYNPYNKTGKSQGKLVGGNLSILYSLLGTDEKIDFSNTILFIEEIGEQLYHLDRMLFAFSKAGIFDKIKGLIVGGMTGMKDTEISIGMYYQEIILSHLSYHNLPVCFDFPVGHIDDNRALVIGKNVELIVTNTETTLNYI